MKLFVGGFVVIAALFALVFISDDTTNTNAATSQQTHTIQTVQADVAQGGLLIDVRTPEEFASGHIKDSVNLPLQDIQNGNLPDSSKDKPVYVYCRSGSRSAQASAALKAAGYTNVIDLGAMSDVQKIGGSVTS